jgi:hypothetical protein
VATVVAILFSGMTMSMPSITPFILIWDFGFTSFMPIPVYLVATWVTVYTIVALLSDKRLTTAGIGMALIAIAGLRLDYSYFALLAMVGTLLIASTSELAKEVELPERDAEVVTAQKSSAPAFRVTL